MQIQDGQIHALINQKDGMVRFLEDPEQYKTSEMIEVMDSVIQRTIGLSKNLIAMDESLSCDPLYLGKVGRERQKFDFETILILSLKSSPCKQQRPGGTKLNTKTTLVLRNRNSLFISIRSSEELVRIVFELGYFTRGRLIKGRREAEQSIEQEGRRRLGDLKHWLDRNGLPPCKVLLKERPLMIRTINPYTMLLLARIFRRVTWRFQFQTLWWSHLRVLGNETIAELLTTNKLSELACLALYLMYEKKQGKKSVWYPYIRELDRQRGRGHLDVESPLLWSEAELEYLTGSPTKVLQLVYASLVIVLELDTVWFMAGSLFQQYPFDIPTEAFSFEIFKQAFAAVQSCVVHLQNVSLARRFALVPLGPPLLAYCSNCKAMLTAVDGAVQLRVDRPYKAGDPIVVWQLSTDDPQYQDKRLVAQRNGKLSQQVFQVRVQSYY
ncbi:hypothetical protein Bca52824_036974 [Brassica carinata]|uniref:Uncharacterized protein n=1 Tax=Brassica carinata TaxID=52824 RepID=A0A8X7S5X1_BRACI|nr:hypothetical protein Bca52824_036974 [Brassica carinata]